MRTLLAFLALLTFCAAITEVRNLQELDEFLNAPGNEHLKASFDRILREAESPKFLSCEARDCEDPDCSRNVTELITSKGYPCEDHLALTSDGYYLSLQRIPHGIDGNKTAGKPAVLLQHGLLDASHTWVINLANQSLGFILADAGFDVWLGNNRGNTYSSTNKYYSVDDDEFWNFTWDQMGSIDLPTQIDYILSVTGHKQISYIGHSEGTTQAFAGFADTALAAKVNLFVALAPVAYVGDTTVRLIQLMATFRVDTWLQILGFDSFLVNSCRLNNMLDMFCDIGEGGVCQVAMCAIAGCNPSNINTTRYDVYMRLDPAGTSVQNMNHWGQMVREENYCKYDYGTRHANKKHYGQPHPPCYDLSKMAAPVALFAGGKDKLGDPKDTAKLISELNPSKIAYSVSIPYYEHMDFVWGMDAGYVLYPQVVSLLKAYATN